MQKKSLLTLILTSVTGLVGTILGSVLLKNRHYYLLSVAVLVLLMIPFFMMFKKSKPKTRELVCISAMTAIAVVSRAMFYMVPQIKPMCAIVILSAISFGFEAGFVTGALTMFLSNFFVGQGAWTPFQMFAMGLVGALSYFILRGSLKESRLICAITGGLLCFVVYGLIVDTSSVLIMASDYSFESIMAIYISGIPFNAIHAVTTGIVLFFSVRPIGEKLSRLKIKYGLFER